MPGDSTATLSETASACRRPGQLPVELTGFVGRVGELAEVRRLLGEARLLTLARRTAEAHVEHILMKLGFSSRPQVAALVSGVHAVVAGRPDRGSAVSR